MMDVSKYSNCMEWDPVENDEVYLITRAKEALNNKDIYQSKAWVLTAKSVFPQVFYVQHEAYLIEKASRNANEASECLSLLFRLFPSEQRMWNEIEAILNALRSDDTDPETNFLKTMFSCLPAEIRHRILSAMADRTEDPMEHCRLTLLLLNKFPQSMAQLAIPLIDTLITAEKHGHYISVVNCYRKAVVCDVLPLLLVSPTDLPLKQLYRYLHKTVEFYITYLMCRTTSIPDLNADDNKKDISWDSFFVIFKLFGDRLNWELSSIFTSPLNKDIMWQQIATFTAMRMQVIDNILGVKQLVYCSTIMLAHSLYHYNTILYPDNENKASLILVEAFTSEIEVRLDIPFKMIPEDISQPLISVAEGYSYDICKHFTFALRSWDLLHSRDVFLKEFTKLRQHIRIDPWLHDFILDTSLFRGRVEDFPTEVPLNHGTIRNKIYRASCYYVLKQFYILEECCYLIIKELETMKFKGSFSKLLIKGVVSPMVRHLHYLPLASYPVMQYVVKLLITGLMHSTMMTGRVNLDIVYGELLILSQLNWDSEKRLTKHILKSIREKGSFSYQLIGNYIVQPEIIEELVYLVKYTKGGRNVTLDIIPKMAPQAHSHKRVSAKSAEKESKREVIAYLVNLMEKLKKTPYAVIYEFLLAKANYIK